MISPDSADTRCPAPVSGCRLLLVEDDLNNRKALQTTIRMFLPDYRVDTAANGLEALQRLEAQDYDLVLMDCMMPVMDGYDATAVIRDRTSGVRNHDIPVIALTANNMRGDREKCLAAGMDDFLAKPLDIFELLSVMETCLKGSSDRR